MIKLNDNQMYIIVSWHWFHKDIPLCYYHSIWNLQFDFDTYNTVSISLMIMPVMAKSILISAVIISIITIFFVFIVLYSVLEELQSKSNIDNAPITMIKRY